MSNNMSMIVFVAMHRWHDGLGITRATALRHDRVPGEAHILLS